MIVVEKFEGAEISRDDRCNQAEICSPPESSPSSFLVICSILRTLHPVHPYETSESKKSGVFSTVFLIAANLVPLFGAIYLDWNVFEIVMLYWAENVVIGFFNLLKINTVRITGRDAVGWVGKIFFSVFFTIHYGGFCAGHGAFLLQFFGGDSIERGYAAAVEAFSGPLRWALLMLFLSHGFSFFYNYLGRGENTKTTAGDQMFAPYSRIVALHIAIVLGGIAVQSLNEPTVLLIILVIGKIFMDVKLHTRQHKKALQERSVN